ncbi:MAG: PAS domain-containing protein, partial [Dehalococcoidia bacterium]
MKDRDKTKEQLISELAELHQRIPELEALETKHKRIEKALLASAQQWQRTFDAIGDVVCLQGAEGRILRCNTAMANLLGKSFDEIKGRTCWELMHGTSEPIEGCPIVRMRETHHRETLILPRGDRWLEDSVDPLLDENDNL